MEAEGEYVRIFYDGGQYSTKLQVTEFRFHCLQLKVYADQIDCNTHSYIWEPFLLTSDHVELRWLWIWHAVCEQNLSLGTKSIWRHDKTSQLFFITIEGVKSRKIAEPYHKMGAIEGPLNSSPFQTPRVKPRENLSWEWTKPELSRHLLASLSRARAMLVNRHGSEEMESITDLMWVEPLLDWGIESGPEDLITAAFFRIFKSKDDEAQNSPMKHLLTYTVITVCRGKSCSMRSDFYPPWKPEFASFGVPHPCEAGGVTERES